MTPSAFGPELLGTRLRHLLDLLDGDVAAVYADLGLAGFRPRFTPIVRVLAAGPSSIRDLARATGVTHSAASQTVAQMAKEELVVLTPGTDARRRIVRLTPRAEGLLPALEAEWAATTAAARELETELSVPLSQVVNEALDALCRRPMRERIAAAAPDPHAGARSDRPGAVPDPPSTRDDDRTRTTGVVALGEGPGDRRGAAGGLSGGAPSCATRSKTSS